MDVQVATAVIVVLLVCGTLPVYCGGQNGDQGQCDPRSGQCPSAAAGSIAEMQPAHQGKNIVMVVVDDLGWNDMGYSGAEYKTPNIDRLAAESVRLSQYYVQSVCSPSRAALMSGRYPFRDGLARHVIVNGLPFGLPPEQVTLATALKQAGYATHAFGKWDLGMHTWSHTPTHRGFDSFVGHYNAFITDHYTFETYTDNEKSERFIGRDLHWNANPAVNITDTYSTLLFGSLAVDTVQKHDFFEKPLFLYLAHSALHSPLEAPEAYQTGCEHVSPMSRQKFCAMTQVLDKTVGKLETALRDANAWENTVFIFTTDNGGQATEGSSNYPLRGNKRTVFEGGVRGSAFIHFPEMKPTLKGSHSTALMHLVDWFPTLVEGVAGMPLASIPNLQEQDGMNCWPSLTTGSASPRDEVLINQDPADGTYPGQAALRFENWKLIVGLANCSITPLPADAPGGRCPSGWSRPGQPEVLPVENSSRVWLFDLEVDPEETYDLSEDLPDVVLMMQEKLAKYPLVPQLAPGFDIESDPKNFGGYWMPWII